MYSRDSVVIFPNRSNEDKITMLEDQAYHKDLLSSRKLSEANAMVQIHEFLLLNLLIIFLQQIEKLTGERDNYARIVSNC